MDSVSPIYDPPDPNVARQQITLLQQILDFIDNVRRDPYGTPQQKIADINDITALQLDPSIIASILQMDDDTWRAVAGEAVNVLERVMRESIRESDLSLMTDQLPSQVALRFDTRHGGGDRRAGAGFAAPEPLPQPRRDRTGAADSGEQRRAGKPQLRARAGGRARRGAARHGGLRSAEQASGCWNRRIAGFRTWRGRFSPA